MWKELIINDDREPRAVISQSYVKTRAEKEIPTTTKIIDC